MALITCSECKGNVSTGARACPHCGHPLKAQDVHITHKQDDSYEKGRQEQLGKQEGCWDAIASVVWPLIIIIVIIIFAANSC